MVPAALARVFADTAARRIAEAVAIAALSQVVIRAIDRWFDADDDDEGGDG